MIAAKPWLVLVGGFLGAGKTTLIGAAAKELARRGVRSAAILNDQGESLVDTQYTAQRGINAAEVTVGCFCCKFSALVEAMEQLRRHEPAVIFAEPVGSCTDVAATVVRPLLEYRDRWRFAPLTVLADPQRASQLLDTRADPRLAFLFCKQLQEADLVCFTKSDLYSSYPPIPAKSVRRISALTGEGVAAWLDEILYGDLPVGQEGLDIDYREYASAEAALAWLNFGVTVETAVPCSPAGLLKPFLARLDAGLTKEGIAILHLKMIADSPSGLLKAALCENGQEPVLEGSLDAPPSARHELLLNLRALGSAAELRTIVEQELGAIKAQFTGLRISCFHPAEPKPERRICLPVPS